MVVRIVLMNHAVWLKFVKFKHLGFHTPGRFALAWCRTLGITLPFPISMGIKFFHDTAK